jgi:hypothetical protein
VLQIAIWHMYVNQQQKYIDFLQTVQYTIYGGLENINIFYPVIIKKYIVYTDIKVNNAFNSA